MKQMPMTPQPSVVECTSAANQSSMKEGIVHTTLIIPAHNEEARLEATLHHYCQALLRRLGQNFEVIVVANACQDATADIARQTAASYPQIRVLDIDARIGKGGAILAGFEAAQGARLVFADADAATAPQSLLDLVDELVDFDVVIGSRRTAGSTITRKQSFTRRVFGVLFAWTVRRLFDLPYRDTQCGAKALRADAARQLARVVSEHSWTFDLDLLLCARAANLLVAERPVVWADQPGSQLRLLPTARDVVNALWRMKRSARDPEVPRDFEPPVHAADRDAAVAVSVQ